MAQTRRRGLTVTQSNALALSSQEMTLMEKRLVVVGFAKLDTSDPDLRVRFHINEFNSIFDLSTNANHERLRDGAKLLLSRVVHVEQPDGGWEMFQWVNYARYVPSSRSREGSYVEMEFNRKLKPYIHQLSKNFNSYTLEKIAQMQSFYSVRIFEILHHDSFGGKIPNLEYDLDDLKFRLRLKYTEKSAEVDRYPNYKDFRVRVLEQAQKDCNAYTDLAFTFEGVRKGRRIAAVVFDVRRKLQPKLLEVPDAPAANPLEELELADALREAGFMGDALTTIKHHGHERIAWALKAARKAEKDAAGTAKPVRNLGGLIVHLLKTGSAQNYDVKPERQAALTPRRALDVAEQLKRAFEDARSDGLERHWEAMSGAEREAVHRDMRSGLNAFALKQLELEKWAGSAYRSARNVALLERLPDLFPSETEDIVRFAEQNEFFSALSADDKQTVFANLRPL